MYTRYIPLYYFGLSCRQNYKLSRRNGGNSVEVSCLLEKRLFPEGATTTCVITIAFEKILETKVNLLKEVCSVMCGFPLDLKPFHLIPFNKTSLFLVLLISSGSSMLRS